MRSSLKLLPVLLCVLALLSVTGCSGSGGSTSSGGQTTTTTPPAANVSVTSIAPTTVSAGASSLTLTVTGTGFATGATVQVGTTVVPTTFVSATQLTATVSAPQLLSGGMLPVIVLSGTSSSAAGTPVSLEVDNPVPAITQLTPSGFLTGFSPAVVAVTGTGFVPSSAIQVNNTARPATYVSGTQLNVTLTAADLATPGNLSLTAMNPAPKGGSSSAAAIAINNPIPGTLALAPSSVLVGTSPATITVTGTSFLPTSVVQVGMSPRPTAFVSATQLSFQLTAADQASAGRLSITVVNGAPGGGTSPIATLTVATPTPTPVITTVSPASIVAGASNTSLTVSGTGMTPTSVVQWNGTALSTTYSGPTLLFATVPANLLASPGTASVTVNSPTAPTPLSNAFALTITNPPVPTLTSLSPNYGPINTATKITLNGTGFNANSTVAFNGTVVASTFVTSTQLTVTLPASAVQKPGNGAFTVTTPAPGGGTTGALVFSAYIPIVSNSVIYNPASGLFYVSVPGSAGAPLGNSVVSVDPASGSIGTPIFVGSEPNKLALSADGQTLWVGLDGSSAVRKVNLATQTAGLQFSLQTNNVGWYSNPGTALALAALPGAPDSVVVYNSNSYQSAALSIYDNGVPRANSIASTYSYNQTYALQVDGTRNEIYAGGSGYRTYTYSSTGLAVKAANSAINPASSSFDEMQVSGGRLYTDTGGVYDAESGGLLGTLYLTGTTAASGATFADPTLGKIFVLDNATGYTFSGYNQVQVFKTSDYTSAGSPVPVNVPSSVSNPSIFSVTGTRLTRWGANGLAFRVPFGIYSLQSNSVTDLSNSSADLGVTLASSGGVTTGSNTVFTATVTNTGPATATDVVLTAALPTSGILVAATGTTASCGTAGVIACTLGPIASGASAKVNVAVLQTVAGSSSLAVQVSGSTADPASTNNTATATVAVTGNPYNLVPSLTSLSPAAVQAGSMDTVVTLTGTGFSNAATVLLDGAAVSTTFVSATQLTVTVPATKLASLGWSSIAVSNAAPGGGTSGVLPLSVFNVLTIGVNRLLYDPYSRKLVASVGSGSSSVTGNSIALIAPETGAISTPVSIGSQPTKMALTDDGQILYTILNGANSIARYNMLTNSAEATFALSTSYNYTNTTPRDIAAQPGTENTIAVDLGSFIGTSLFDYTPASKTAAIRGGQTGPYTGSCLQFLNATSLYAFDIDTTGAVLVRNPVTATGLSYSASNSSGSTLNRFGCFKINGGLAFANAGGVADPAPFPALQVGTFAGLSGGTFSSLQALAPDTSLGRAFFPARASSSSLSNDSVIAYDIKTFLASAILPLNMGTIEGNTSYSLVDMIRWGQDGLAVLTSGGHIYLLRGPFITPQLLNTNSAATLTAASVSSIAHGAGNTTLTLTGANFVPGVAVTWNGSYRTSTIVDATHVTVAIPASDLASAGSGSVVATNPGAPASGALTVTVN